ncbi:MAG TPA: type II toxin-antitoxin system VapB family antitoxin [Longimicrobiales bacterium]|nr:type II toxin-antitoxin system VapB family antitoxin [Longimicrobiales bacterium]
MSEDRARVFWSGRSQAVRLPKEYRFDVEEVRIRRRGAAVILEPIPTDWSWLDALTAGGTLDDDAADFSAEEPPEQRRPELDSLF